MKDYIENRVIEIARYILETQSTVRKTAKEYNISKSTVHKDVTERLAEIDAELRKRCTPFWTSTRRSVIFVAVWQPKKNT